MQAKTQAIPPKAREEVSPLPSGGTEGQVLTMGETEAEWEDLPKELPEGGTAGQVLTLEVPEGETDPVPAWADAPTEHKYRINITTASTGVVLPEDGHFNIVPINRSVTGYLIDDGTQIFPDMPGLKNLLFAKNGAVMPMNFYDGGNTCRGYIAPSENHAAGRVISATGSVAYDVVVKSSGDSIQVIIAKTAFTAT